MKFLAVHLLLDIEPRLDFNMFTLQLGDDQRRCRLQSLVTNGPVDYLQLNNVDWPALRNLEVYDQNVPDVVVEEQQANGNSKIKKLSVDIFSINQAFVELIARLPELRSLTVLIGKRSIGFRPVNIDELINVFNNKPANTHFWLESFRVDTVEVITQICTYPVTKLNLLQKYLSDDLDATSAPTLNMRSPANGALIVRDEQLTRLAEIDGVNELMIAQQLAEVQKIVLVDRKVNLVNVELLMPARLGKTAFRAF